ncbi:MAG: hypothetical protein FWF46_03460 [Oscillospiraceae bacterium]|nr:hypothetical protein [Oscillospiraceae bacterium]
MKDGKIVIDSHSHIGIDMIHGETDVNEYIIFADNQGIDYSFLMPVPAPVINSKRVLYWNYSNEFCYRSDFANLQQNGFYSPYEVANDYYDKKIKELNTKRISFVPLIHPKLDDYNSLMRLYEKYNPTALKIHGVSAGAGPNDVNIGIIKFLRENNIPLILHTDFDNNLENGSGVSTTRRINSPKDWASFIIENNLKAILNHGARLDLETFALVNGSNNLTVAIGPEVLMMTEPSRLMIEPSLLKQHGYLGVIKKYLDIDKIIFDIDYNWNTLSLENRTLDYDSLNRVTQIFNENEAKQVFSSNLVNFFNLKELSHNFGETKGISVNNKGVEER